MSTLQKTQNKAVSTDDASFIISFDFTDADQKSILDKLQKGYSLYGFKGAKGAGQVTAGVPVWFTRSFNSVFGSVTIDYQPLYKVYAFNQDVIGAFTTIEMSVLSNEYPLGTALIFQPDGTFTVDPVAVAPAGAIQVTNNSDSSTPAITFGLAAPVHGVYAPFCAFTCPPKNAVSMEPIEKVCLFAAESGEQSGSVVGNTAAPGCTFDLDSDHTDYDLLFIDNTFGITSAPGSLSVDACTASSSLNQLLASQ